MDELDSALDHLERAPAPGYHAGSFAAAEPTALATLALLAHGRFGAARPLVDRLLSFQQPDGSVSIVAGQAAPGWPTAWAMLAWQAAQRSELASRTYQAALDRALHWTLKIHGSIDEKTQWLGVETPIQGWPWVDGTHAWLEPSALNLLALKQTGHANHPRARQAALLLINRLLETGGCNYGNTVVFGQALRAHLEPTGVCLLALAGEDDPTGRVERSIEYLQRELSERTATASLCYGLMGLAAQQALPTDASTWLEVATRRTLNRDPASYKLALLALASLGVKNPLIARTSALAANPSLQVTS